MQNTMHRYFGLRNCNDAGTRAYLVCSSTTKEPQPSMTASDKDGTGNWTDDPPLFCILSWGIGTATCVQGDVQ
jgi:hypothetical protein